MLLQLFLKPFCCSPIPLQMGLLDDDLFIDHQKNRSVANIV